MSKDDNIHCYYETMERGTCKGVCPEFGASAYGPDRDGCEEALTRIVKKKSSASDRCFTHHATGEAPVVCICVHAPEQHGPKGCGGASMPSCEPCECMWCRDA